MSIKLFPDDGTPILPSHPFAPVYEQFRDIAKAETATVQHVVECVVTIALTAAANMKTTFDSIERERGNDSCPLTHAAIVRTLCMHIMEASKEVAESVGEGATKQ